MLAVAALLSFAVICVNEADDTDAKTAVVTDDSGTDAVITYTGPPFVLEFDVPECVNLRYYISGEGYNHKLIWGSAETYPEPQRITKTFAVSVQGVPQDLAYGSYTIICEHLEGSFTISFNLVPDSYTLTYDQMYDGQPDPKLTSEQQPNENYNIRGDITREGYYLEGWYTDVSLESQYKVTSETPFTANTDQTLYAKWLQCIDKPEATTGYTYNGEIHTGVPEGTGYTLDGTYSTKTAGNYTVTASLDTGYIWSDYTYDDVELEWSISKAPLTVTAQDKSVTYGEGPPAYTAEYSEFAPGDDESSVTGLVLACDYSVGDDADTYPITASGASSVNYSLSYVPGTLTVNKAELEIPTAVTSEFTYNGSEQTYTPEGYDSDTMSKTNDKRTNAGSQTVSVSIKDTTNYKWSDDSSEAKAYDFTI